MGRTTLLAKLAGESKNCKWIYRIRANPGMPRGGIVPPTPVLAPGSALGSRPQGLLEALSLPGRFPTSGSQLAGRLEHAVDAGGTDSHDVGVEHHVHQPPVPFQGSDENAVVLMTL